MFYTKEALEALADSINERNFPKRLLEAIPLDPYDLVDRLGCSVDWKYLSPDDTILGATFFTDGAWPIWPNGTYQKGDVCVYTPYRAGSIVINQRLLDSKKKNARQYENYVVCHECAHWNKDQEYFRSHFADNVFHLCQKNDFEKTGWWKALSDLEIIERQANYLAAAILMPRDAITREFFRIGRYRNIPNQPIEYTKYVRGWVAKLAKKYDLNFNPVLYRLRDLNIIWMP